LERRYACLGQVALATFDNPDDLVNPGNNAYEQTSESGIAQISTPGSTNHGVLQGSETEDSILCLREPMYLVTRKDTRLTHIGLDEFGLFDA
jgi:flagellar basal body rod protein FlgG